MEQGFHEIGLARLRQAVAAEPSSPVFLANLGIASRGQGHLVEALACLKRAQSLDPVDLRVDRLALLMLGAKPAGLLPVSAGKASGILLPAFSPLRNSFREGLGVTLHAAPREEWELKVMTDSLPSVPLSGSLIASVWNEAGLFLKEGKLEWGTSEQGMPLARIQGPPPLFIQRRRAFRILCGDFMRALALGKGSAQPDLRDLSSQGLSYYDDNPPRLGNVSEWRIRLEGVEMDVPSVVRAVRAAPTGRPVVGVEFLLPDKKVDQMARAIHEYQRRLRTFQHRTKGE